MSERPSVDARPFMTAPPPQRDRGVLALGNDSLAPTLWTYGLLSPREKPTVELLRRCVACVCPRDDVPSALLAMAAGCLVVTDGVLREVPVQVGKHYLVAPVIGDEPWDGSARTILVKDVAAMVAATSDQARARLGEAARRTVMAYCTPEAHLPAVIASAAYLRDLAATVPDVLDDYMWPGERALMVTIAKALRVDGAFVEVGVGNGGTLCALAATCSGREVHGIDDFSYGSAAQKERVLGNLALLDADRVSVTESRSAQAPFPQRIAFLHIDAGHDYEHCHGDLHRFAHSVVPGGVLAVDDYGTHLDQPGVRLATDNFVRETGRWEPITMGPKLAFWRRV